ncbi:MAG: GNAT family N-acetyltransferase [Candidatus Dormibacteraeota bacterium]|nr:GNAT family N-acetyltransferase [Candidatus Dormibacteraeota bacterium]
MTRSTSAVIRPATVEDLDRFIEVRLRALGDSPFAFGSTLELEREFERHTWDAVLARVLRDEVLQLAVDGSRTVGMARGEPWDGRPGVAGLFGMWVAPGHRGLGVGRRLVDGVLAWATSAGSFAVELDVTVGNLPAVRLYQACGFRDTGERSPMPRDPSMLEMRMRLELPRKGDGQP